MNAPVVQNALTKRWYPLNAIPEYDEMWDSKARFKVNPAGRRSGKTENWKRATYIGHGHGRHRGALNYDLPFDDGWFVMSAPTHKQAKRIFWRDMKSLCPKWAKQRVLESEMTIRLINGVEITVMGMDSPDRLEGRPLDAIVLDEYGNMKRDVWYENIYPALSTLGRPGWAALIGVPEGRNHYFELFNKAKEGGNDEWSAHTWFSEKVLPISVIVQAKKDLDELTYQQEFCGSFVNFEGLAYYAFGDHNYADLKYDPDGDLIFCFDFNVSPGVAVVCQEQTKAWYAQEHKIQLPANVADEFTAVVGEVHIPRHSNTPRVCRKLIEDWGHHEGRVFLYGDATGGAKGTQSVMGSDWDLIDEAMEEAFGRRARNMVTRRNPRERVRVNSVNSRCKTLDDTVRLLVDSSKSPRLIDDMLGVMVLEGSAGELDKDSDSTLTHMSDALGYYMAEEHQVGGGASMEVG